MNNNKEWNRHSPAEPKAAPKSKQGKHGVNEDPTAMHEYILKNNYGLNLLNDKLKGIII